MIRSGVTAGWVISRLVRLGRRDTVVRREALAQGSIFILRIF